MGKSIQRPSIQSFNSTKSYSNQRQNMLLITLTSFLLCSILQISVVQSAGQDNIDLAIGSETSYYQLSPNEVMYFQLRLTRPDFSGKEDLIIKVQSNELKGDPDIYLSRQNTKPNSRSNSEYACETSGRDICSINHKLLSSGQYVYVGVKCLEDCKFSLIASLQEALVIEDSIELQVDFQTNESKLFKFYVPAASSSKDEENRVSSVTITAAPILSLIDNIILTATAVKDQTPSTKSSRGVAGWRKGQVLRLSEISGTDWCSDCWITILVDVVELGKYSIMAKSNVGVLQLQADSKVDDVAFFGDKTCYKYYVQNTDTDLLIKVQQFSGLISFTVNPKKPAESYDSSVFKYVGTQNSVLKISPADRKNASQPRGVYYICAVPHMTSTYSIIVSEPAQNQFYTYLEDGYDEKGEIQGTNLIVYVYKVPPLEYKGEDIELKFKLNVISGKAPYLGAAFCQDKKDHKRCVSGLKASDIKNTESFAKGSKMGNDIYININHDERKCQDEYNGQCYYIIGILGQQSEQEFTSYTMSVNHGQLNYQVLSENQMVTDYVNMGQQRYYSFTLMADKKVKKVTIKLITLHGDADLYVSRVHPYPNKIDYEKSSVHTNIAEDEVSFETGNLTCNYFILVQSPQYSTYSLLVKVSREGQDQNGEVIFEESILQLSEGVSIKGFMTGIQTTDNYKIYIKQLEGYEKSIRLQLQPVKGRFELYVNYGSKASQDKHFVSTKDNYIEIKPTDKNFKREGYYYLNVRPRKNLWSILTDDSYEYALTFSTQDSYLYLTSKEAIETQQSSNSYQYFRHFITQKQEDISVAMTIFNGNPIMYISINPGNMFPTKNQFDFNSSSQANVFGNNGKSIYIASQKIQQASEACSPDIYNYVDLDPCAIFVGIYCENDCKYSLKLSYERGGPQKLTFGMPLHDVVKEDSINYYYLIVREGKAKQIYAVLNSLSGNADLYVNFQDNPQNSAPETWRLPTQTQYAIKSTEILKQDMVSIQDSSLKDCFGRFNGGQDQTERICALVFGIYSPQSPQDPENKQNTGYNFVVYSDIIFIQSGSIMSGKVSEGEFQYYIFDALCHDCPIVVSLSTYSSGDPDLYISYGDHNLPTKQTYDIYSSTYKSELIRISLDMDQIKDASIKSLKGSWIIGVYGVKKSDFSISVTQEKNPISQLIPGMGLKVSQLAYETTYFMYYHDRDQTDLEILIDPTFGRLDVYINTFNDADQTQNFASKLPKSKRNSLWVKENISPISKHDEKTIIILNEEKNFCDQCFYLIGVISQEQNSDYSIMAHPLDANFQNSLLLKISDIQSFAMKKGDQAIFKFILDEMEDVRISLNTKQGYVKADLSLSSDKTKSFKTILPSQSFTLEKTNPNFRVGEITYLIMTCDLDASFTIQIDQDRNILTLRDGVSTKLNIDYELPRHFIFPLPSGKQALTIQIKSTKDNLYPQLMFREMDDVSNPNAIQFPPSGPKFNSYYVWDKNFGTLTAQKNIQIKSNKGGLAITLIETLKGQSGDIYITVSISSTVQLQALQTYNGILRTENSFMIYFADQYFGVANGVIRVEFANCVGNNQVLVVDQANGHDSQVEQIDLKERYEHGRTYYYVPLPRKSLYLMVKPNLVSWDRSKSFEPHEYLLKVKYLPSITYESQEQKFQETNRLSLDDYQSIFQLATISWKPMFLLKLDGVVIKAEQTFVLVVTTDGNLNLENICQARTSNFSRQDQVTRTYFINTTQFTIPNIIMGERYYINVFSRIRYNYNEEVEVIPYVPYELHIRPSGLFKLTNIIILVVVLLVLVSFYQIYQRAIKSDKPFYRPKEPSRQVEFELTQVSSRSNHAGEYQVPSELIRDVSSETDRLNTTQTSAGF